MSDVIEWVLEMDIADGKAEEFSALIAEMVTATKANEPGCLHYEYYTNESMTKMVVLERYEDTAAAMTHVVNFGTHFAERFFAILTPTSFKVYGPAGEDLVGALSQFGAVHMGYHNGFAR